MYKEVFVFFKTVLKKHKFDLKQRNFGNAFTYHGYIDTKNHGNINYQM